jgi:hypothetical protein
MLRSETMCHGTLVVPAGQRARGFIDKVGGLSCMQFTDMNANRLGTYSRIGLIRIKENLQSYWTDKKSEELTVVLNR